jgi:hypothetical protein
MKFTLTDSLKVLYRVFQKEYPPSNEVIKVALEVLGVIQIFPITFPSAVRQMVHGAVFPTAYFRSFPQNCKGLLNSQS